MPDFVQERHKARWPLDRPRELILACPPMRSNVNLSRIVRAAACCGIPRMICCGNARILPEISRETGDAIQIEGWPVQFLPATQPLVAEAVCEATVRESAGLTTRVMSAEHLMAIAMQTGRAKDHARLIMFVEAEVADMDRLHGILARHSLLDSWVKFENRFLKP